MYYVLCIMYYLGHPERYNYTSPRICSITPIHNHAFYSRTVFYVHERFFTYMQFICIYMQFICINIHVYIYYVYIYLYIYIYACIFAYIHVYIYTCNIRTCICIYTNACKICTYTVYIYAIYIYIYAETKAHMNIHAFIHTLHIHITSPGQQHYINQHP